MPKLNNVCLVTGGAGFIGSELVRQLLNDGLTVIVLDNFSFGLKSNLPENNNLHIVEGDITDFSKVEETFSNYQPSRVFHLAAIHFIPYCNQHPQETIKVNVIGTLNILEACKKNDIDSVIYTSTAAVYGIKDNPHQETEEPDPVDIYGESKLFGEFLLKRFHRETGIRSFAARLFNGYGRRETNPHVIPEIVNQVSKSDQVVLGNIAPKRDFIHTADISRALRLMSGKEGLDFGTFNVGTGEEHSVTEIVNVISDLLGKPIEIICEEGRKRKVERYHLSADTLRIRSTLGWLPQVTLRDGFRDMLESVSLL